MSMFSISKSVTSILHKKALAANTKNKEGLDEVLERDDKGRKKGATKAAIFDSDSSSEIQKLRKKGKKNLMQKHLKKNKREFKSGSEIQIKKHIPLAHLKNYVLKCKTGGNTFVEVPMQNSDWLYYNKMRYEFETRLFTKAAK